MICVFDNPEYSVGKCIFADPSAASATITDTRGAMSSLMFSREMKLLKEDDLILYAIREFTKRLIV